MKIGRKNMVIFLAVICTVMFLSSNTFAGKASFEEGGSLSPPYGATGDPGGTKLTGVMYIHYLNYHQEGDPVPGEDPNYVADGARFALRLQREKSAYPIVYYAVYDSTDPDCFECCDPSNGECPEQSEPYCGDSCTEGEVCVRLENSECEPLDFSNPSSILEKFYNILEVYIEVDFFDGDDMDIKIKSLKNYGNVDYFPNGDQIPPQEIVVLVDVELAAKPAEF